MLNARIWFCCLACIAATCSTPARAADAKPTGITVYPADIQLTNSQDRQSFLVQAVYANGVTADVTDQAKISLANDKLVRREGNVFRPSADGKTELKIEYAGFAKTIPVSVEKAQTERPVSFILDVMPVFMKKGCNMGSCHGAARGKDGFRLSLFGFDPRGDHYRLTREMSGRRINLALPEESLLLEKAIGAVPHTGGSLFDKESEYYQSILRWLNAGAPLDPQEIPTVDRVELYPAEAVLAGANATQRLSVRAYYSDGTTRDVTSQAYFMTNNSNSAEVSQAGIVTSAKRGEAFITARFEAHTVGSHFIVVPADSKFQWQETPEHNYIDQLVHQKLRKLQIQPSGLCTDEEFLRRVYIDIVGLLPTAGEYQQFMADSSPDKRARLIDELLTRKEFVEMWVMKWAELLQIRQVNNRVTYKSALRYFNWVQDKLANNVPMDQMVQELIGSSGGTFSNAATNYYQNETDTLKTAENVAQVFMGMRIQCAQCHNHPFDRWTMDDYYAFASFFSQIGRKRGEDPREQIIYNRGGGEVKHIVTNKPLPPKFLGGAVPDLKGRDRRVVVAQWLASPENPYFATNLVNIVWAHFLGRGIIHEVDDVRVSNPPVNEALLQELGKRFTDYHYDFRRLVRDICNSRTYQLSTATNETNATDLANFSHANLRRLRAEVLLDTINQVTNTQEKFRGLPLGARAVQIADGNTSSYFLTTFGRATRETVCSCEVKMEPNLSQALHLINGTTVNNKISQGKIIQTMLAEKKSPEDVLSHLYISALSRKPDEKEIAALQTALKEDKNAQAVLEDFFWALLNSQEFLFNH